MEGRKLHRLTDKRWQAICENDFRQDGEFFYGVKTTKIFCRPSCKSRVPKKENIFIFKNGEEAKEIGFRPCKRCKPEGEKVPNEEWADQVKKFLDQNYSKPLTLEVIAEECHGSPFYLHRTFKAQVGISPIEYLNKIRMEKAKDLLRKTKKPISEIGLAVGIVNGDHFSTKFRKYASVTPLQYRKMEEKRG